MRLFVLLLCTQFFVQPVVAQTLNTQKLDSLFWDLDGNNEAMGSVAVFKSGQLLYEKTIGYRSISDNGKLSATTATKYRAASITKMFTATLIFQLIDENKLTLNTIIDTWFPDIQNAHTITVRQLLCHRSGLRNYITTETWIMGRKTEQELLALSPKALRTLHPAQMQRIAILTTGSWAI